MGSARGVVGLLIGVVTLFAITLGVVHSCRPTPYRGLRVGECLPGGARVVGVREQSPPRVSCSERHRFEVYAVTSLTGDRWPGQAEIDARSERLCVAALPERTPLSAQAALDSGVEVIYLTPSEDSWSRQGDREVECVLRFPKDRTASMVTVPASDPGGVG